MIWWMRTSLKIKEGGCCTFDQQKIYQLYMKQVLYRYIEFTIEFAIEITIRNRF